MLKFKFFCTSKTGVMNIGFKYLNQANIIYEMFSLLKLKKR